MNSLGELTPSSHSPGPSGLAGRPADVHPDVVPVGGDDPVKVLFRLQRKRAKVRPLISGEIEECGEVPERDQQQMTRRDRVKIRSRIPARGTKENLLILGSRNGQDSGGILLPGEELLKYFPVIHQSARSGCVMINNDKYK